MPSPFLEIYEGAVKAFKEVGDIYDHGARIITNCKRNSD